MAGKPIEAVAESANFCPAFHGQEYITLTFRVPKSQGVRPGIWELKAIGAGSRDWAIQKHPELDSVE